MREQLNKVNNDLSSASKRLLEEQRYNSNIKHLYEELVRKISTFNPNSILLPVKNASIDVRDREFIHKRYHCQPLRLASFDELPTVDYSVDEEKLALLTFEFEDHPFNGTLITHMRVGYEGHIAYAIDKKAAYEHGIPLSEIMYSMAGAWKRYIDKTKCKLKVA